jgi:hypothetical protein
MNFVLSYCPSSYSAIKHFHFFPRHFFWQYSAVKNENMLTLLLFAAGFICFWFFFKSVDWFEKI